MARRTPLMASLLGLVLAAVLGGCGGGDAAAPSTDGATGSPTPRLTPETAEETPASPRPRRTPRPERPQRPQRPEPPAPERPEPRPVVDTPILGADFSWPQCPVGMGIPEKRSQGSPLPLETAEYVVIGLTNGPGFTPNPCLPSQVDFARSRALLASAYAVASYPDSERVATFATSGPFDGADPLGALANTGYQQARFNVTSMLTSGLETPVVWIDVEPVPDFEWSGDLESNAAVVRGVARGYRDAGYRIGVYSTPALWDGVVGDLELGVPEWRAAGQTSRAEALARCGADWVIQGGKGVLGQWVEDGRDQNVTCPGISLEMERWFHQY